VSPWNYVPGTYVGVAKPMVFSGNTQTGGNFGYYLGCVAGPTQNFFVGSFSGLNQVNSNTGAHVSSIGAGGGARLGPATAPNGNVAVGGLSGIEEYNSTTGAFVRTVNNYGSGFNLLCFDGDTMYATQWQTGGGTTIKQFSFTTGASTGPDIAVPFSPQEIGIGPDGALYASGLYDGTTYSGVLRYNGSAWTMFADAEANGPSGTGPHGFAWDPVNFDLYLAYQTGEIERYNGFTGQYLNRIDTIATKLTDVLFKVQVPAPSSLALLGLGGLVAARRRR
jgi:hypothetical protein